jgi:hypothetical protein
MMIYDVKLGLVRSGFFVCAESMFAWAASKRCTTGRSMALIVEGKILLALKLLQAQIRHQVCTSYTFVGYVVSSLFLYGGHE